MDKKTFIRDFKALINKLNKIDTELNQDSWDWEVIDEYFKKTREIHKKLLEYSSQMDQFLESKDKEFNQEYLKLKEAGLTNIDHLSKKIRGWIEKQREKISESADIMKNIKRYNPDQQTSYYIDKSK